MKTTRKENKKATNNYFAFSKKTKPNVSQPDRGGIGKPSVGGQGAQMVGKGEMTNLFGLPVEKAVLHPFNYNNELPLVMKALGEYLVTRCEFVTILLG